MAKLVEFLEATSNQLGSLPLQDGRFIYETDTKMFYRDSATERVLLSGDFFMSIDNEKATWTIVTNNKRVKVAADNVLGTLSFSLSGT